ncbi:T9SS type A sorting domain-containing protein [Lacinutrix sp.]|uniref:T9SS type A sorting domain-containing protein n=1 Tax=Lacinutrix sp. TaxID=1937692 RepID=UPI0026229133|nr:T9SS type A sorting domain-containing protein [Lacinutrix sp.]MDG1714678.1 T9SS type A sorting domain-containing protein [Lacinutrix sp.]
MKKIYSLFIILLSASSFAQEFKPLDYSNFDFSDLKTNLFIKNVSPLSSIAKNSDTYTMYGFLQQYKEFANNDNNGLFDNFKNLQRFNQPINYSKTISIGLMHVEYETLNKESLNRNDVILKNKKVERVNSNYIFNYNTSTLISPLTSTKRGLETSYILNDDFYVNNTSIDIVSIQANFNDGNGLIALASNTPININYTTEGKKNITFIIELSNGDIITRHSSIIIEASRKDIALANRMTSSEITSSIVPNLTAYSGATSHAGLAEYEVFLGADNVLDKPIFIIDGFDPSDSRNIAGLYSLLDFDNNGTTENLADKVRNDDDFDVVLINFPTYFLLSNGTLQSLSNSTDVNGDTVIDTLDYPGSTLVDGGADFIERNAFSVVDIINLINSQKTGSEENVIIGPSMGGLISRYALNYMEANSLTHETRLWLSFDSPHLGANVPIGFQHLFNYLGYGLDTWVGDFSLEAVRPIVDGMLKSPAARQMLTDHFEPHLENGEIAEFDSSILLPVAHDYSVTFFSGINSLTTSGFPETTRNVSLINGSGIGNPYQDKNGNDLDPGDKVIDAFLPSVAFLTDAYFDTWFTPYANQTIKIDDIWIDAPFLCFCDIHAEPDSKAFSFSDGIDAAPGGLFDLGALAAGMVGTDPTIDAFFAALSTDYFNFIPTVSAMALSTNPNLDWFQNINLGNGDTPWDATTTTNSQTPFVNWYMPDNNEPHVTLTQQNVNFALSEIIEDNTLNTEFFDSNFIKVKNNPFNNTLTLLSSSLINNANVSIVDITGKVVYNSQQNINKEAQITLNIASGIYILNIKTNENYTFRTKIIKQ